MLAQPFFDSVQHSLFGAPLNPTQRGMLNALDKAWAAHGNGNQAAEAYVFATVFNELSSTLVSRAENLNYSAERARQVWSNIFPSVEAAKPYQHDPVKLGNHVYAKKNGNGPEASGDGYKYRGRGPSQLTGLANYKKFSQLLGLDLVNNPDTVLDQDIGAAILVTGMVIGRFTSKKLDDYFGRPGVDDDPVHARAIVNGDVAANGQKIAANQAKFLSALKGAGHVVAPAAPVVAAQAEVAAPALKVDPIIQAWQERLLAVAKAEGRPNPLSKYGADGRGGTETETAIKAFQSSRNPPLTVTGQLDDATRAALNPPSPPKSINPALAEFAAEALVNIAIPPSPAKDMLMNFLPSIVQWVIAILPGIPDDLSKINAEIAEIASNKDGVAKVRSFIAFARAMLNEAENVVNKVDPQGAIAASTPIPPAVAALAPPKSAV